MQSYETQVLYSHNGRWLDRVLRAEHVFDFQRTGSFSSLHSLACLYPGFSGLWNSDGKGYHIAQI